MPDVVRQLESVPVVLNGEKLIGLSPAARLFPGHRDNAHLNASTVYRWVVKGTRTPDGGIVRLEAARVGSRWLTSAEAVARFVTATTAAATAPSTSPPPPIRSPGRRSRENSRASAELDALGVK
jgi:hypothetical protein